MGIIDIKRPIVLATASEARRKLVSDLGLNFTVTSVDIDESQLPGEALEAYVLRLACAKADAVTPPSIDSLIVTVDTAIGIGDRIIGKADDEKHAREILSELSGREHTVASAIAVRDIMAAEVTTEVTQTAVKFIELTDRMIDWYIRTGEWKGRAGAYAIQGKGASLIAEVRGCFTNIIGISMPSLLRLLARSGTSAPEHLST